MVLVLALPIRHVYHLENLITERHINNCAKLMLATGLIVAYTYVVEPFTAWYGGERADNGHTREENARELQRLFGALVGVVPGLLRCDVGIDVSRTGESAGRPDGVASSLIMKV